jgi:uncharacterized protein YdeI (YjbR/CyaY-like superfamily)
VEDALEFADSEAFEAWLAEHHAGTADVWLKIAKKSGGATSVTVTEALDVALCYGWIDGQRKVLDDAWFLQRYCPRRKRSSWSQVNVAKVDVLLAAGRMRPPGQAEIDAAKADGRWDGAYPSQKEATVPPDLAAALEADPRASAYFDTLGRTDRYLVIMRLLKVRTPATRATILTRQVAALAEQRKP